MEENEMLEQTNETENTETQTAEELEGGIELTDTTDDTVSDEETETVEEETKEDVKMFTQEEVDNIVRRRLARSEREHEKELSKYLDTENVLRTTLKLNDGDDTNEKLRELYEADGVKLPEKIRPGLSSHEIEVLAKDEAENIIADGYDAMVEEANRLAAKKYENLSSKEKIIFNTLAEKLTEEKNRKELLKLGAKEELLSDKEFESFRKQFNSNVPMETIYSLYTKIQPKKEVELPGSMKSSKEKSEKTFISEAEYDKMSREEIRKNMDLIEKSMPKW